MLQFGICIWSHFFINASDLRFRYYLKRDRVTRSHFDLEIIVLPHISPRKSTSVTRAWPRSLGPSLTVSAMANVAEVRIRQAYQPGCLARKISVRTFELLKLRVPLLTTQYCNALEAVPGKQLSFLDDDWWCAFAQVHGSK